MERSGGTGRQEKMNVSQVHAVMYGVTMSAEGLERHPGK